MATRTMKNRIKIVMFLNTTVFGGVEKHVVDIVNAINEDKFIPYIICPTELYPHLQQALGQRKTRIIPIRKASFTNWGSINDFINAIRKIQPDIVHCHLYNATRFASPILKLLKVPCVIETAHIVERWRKGYKKIFLRIDWVISLFVDRVIAVSNAVADFYITVKHYPPKKVKTIHNWCDLNRFSSTRTDLPGPYSFKTKEGIGRDKLVVGIVGRLEEQKGHRYFIEALPDIVKKHGENLAVIFVGDGGLKEELHRLAEANGTLNFIHFLGFRKDIPELLSVMDILVLPSLFEGMPLTLIEAGAMGIPVVATEVDGSTDVVLEGKTGYLVKPYDTATMAERVNTLLSDHELRQQMSRAAIQHVHACFDMKKQVGETEQLYLAVLKSKSA